MWWWLRGHGGEWLFWELNSGAGGRRESSIRGEKKEW